jgi:O-antigen/teichoic acid export membrane protein
MTCQVMDAAHGPGAPSCPQRPQEDTMTALTAPAPTDRDARLRTLLRADAGLCAVTGLLAAAVPSAVADLLGPDVSATVVRVVGIALVVWAVDALLLTRTRGRLLTRVARVAAAGNLAWEVGTLVLVALGAFSGTGAVVALLVAAVVGGLGLVQLRAARSS